jgi:uncharacterized integral membrane protein
MFSLILAVVILIIIVVFSVQNAGPVAVSFLFWRFEASLAVVITLSLLAGIIIGMAILTGIRMGRASRKKKSPEREP